MMKKIIVLTFVMLICFASVCSAFNLDRNRWLTLISNNDVELLLDTRTIQYNENDTNVWVCYVIEKDNKYTLQNVSVYSKKREVAILSFVEYNYKTDKINASDTFSYSTPKPVVPGSYGEYIYNVISYARQGFEDEKGDK